MFIPSEVRGPTLGPALDWEVELRDFVLPDLERELELLDLADLNSPR